jgi:mycothiol synthase
VRSLPAGYQVRPAAFEDLSHVAAMIASADLVDVGESDFTEQMLRDDWRRPELDLATDTWVLTRDREIAAYGYLLARDRGRQLDGYGLVHPTHRGRGLGTYLVLKAERRAQEQAATVPLHEEIVLHSGVLGSDEPAHRLLERHGYRVARYFWRMSIELPEVVDAPEPPIGIAIHPFRQGDAGPVHTAFEEAFSEHWGWVRRTFEDWATHRLDPERFDPALWSVAVEGDEVVGALAGAVDGNEGWVETLGVRVPWRGRGIGEALLRRSFATFSARGIRLVSLFVDAENETGATRLYERVGMSVRRRYDSFEKRLPGRSANRLQT